MSAAEQDAASEARRRIDELYSPERFGELAETWRRLLTSHLRSVESSSGKVLNWNPPEVNVREAERQLAAGEGSPVAGDQLEARFQELAEQCLSRGQNLHDPRYIGHQVPPPSPIAGLFDALGTVTNQVMAVYEMGPWATAVERALIHRWGEALGLPAGRFAGLITSGGSLANLTALLTARNVALPEAWEHGLPQEGPRPALVVHADAHYGIARSAGMLGLGTQQVIRAPLDERRRMDPDALDAILAGLARDGTPVVAVVACSCATPIGAFDSLPQIADVCERHGVWLHVDAAHGGGMIFSETRRGLLDGLARADSFICDAHKMLFVPALCAFVFYKRPEHRFEAFRQEAPYLFDPSAPAAADYDVGLMTVECTKRAAAFGLWGVWSLFGSRIFGDLVDATCDGALRLHSLIVEADDFEPLHEPQGNIVVFRHVPDWLRGQSLEAIGDANREIRRRLILSGRYYLTQTSLGGAGALRCTVMNPLTVEAHFAGLLEALRDIGRQVAGL
ncbi:MAG: aminotransferase class I/II-fold pyridoxal phosphate-dependent enzyme [Planctomyces sp.]|nr:aminotransferase class I/II-fold pyridoxal phosphate-dependent enzyme [Planctomyces sp.]